MWLRVDMCRVNFIYFCLLTFMSVAQTNPAVASRGEDIDTHNLKGTYHSGYSSYQHSLNYGWELVGKGRSRSALEIFAQLARSNPSNGDPKIGYAVAAADLGLFSKSVWAMRRALEYEPSSLHRLSIGTHLAGTIGYLSEQFRNSYHGLNTSDTYFMLAVLYYLLGEPAETQSAIEVVRHSGDYSKSAQNLYYLVDQEW